MPHQLFSKSCRIHVCTPSESTPTLESMPFSQETYFDNNSLEDHFGMSLLKSNRPVPVILFNHHKAQSLSY